MLLVADLGPIIPLSTITPSPTTQAERIERFCNDVAGELLLPPAALPQRPANLAPGDKDRVVPLVDSIAAQWSVSQPMVAYRLHRLGWITPLDCAPFPSVSLARPVPISIGTDRRQRALQAQALSDARCS